MLIKDATVPKSRESKRKRDSFLCSCFWGSSVFESNDLELMEITAVEAIHDRKGKRKVFWFSWSRFKKKKKKKTIEAQNGENPNNQQQNSTDSQLHEDVGAASQQQLPSSTISTDSNNRAKSTQPSSNPNPIQIRSSTNRLSSPRRITRRTSSSHHIVRTGQVKPVVGLWIMVTTLGVMVSFGRASAVVFLSSCLYMLPFIRAATGEDGGPRMSLKRVDLNSEEHKKRVIMEGLLERKQQRPSHRY